MEDRVDALDFWLGSWDVHTADGSLAGTNLIEPALDGHVVLEHWRSVDGGEGKSLFYYEPSARTWNQVWVTSAYVKEKVLAEATGERLRFEGHVIIDGRTLPDRTTLTLLRNGDVRQLIEHSLDDGATWIASFDAVYVRRRRRGQDVGPVGDRPHAAPVTEGTAGRVRTPKTPLT